MALAMCLVRVLRITLQPDTDAVRLVLEGRLADAWVSEAEATWRHAQAIRHGRSVEVDLRDVLAVDDAGRALLGRMAQAGARLLACGCAMREMVREVADAAPVVRELRTEGEERLS
ncbi:MAG: hypothetical protein IT178_01305 [Acidobacteria bacterium]|nr:hypothetical protein [Acidobacteriota bacterium]